MTRQPTRAEQNASLLVLCLLVLSAAPACATSPAASQPASIPDVAGQAIRQTESAASAPSQTQPTQDAVDANEQPTDPAAMKILLTLEQAGGAHHTVRADLEMTVVMPQLGDSERRTGWVAYERPSQEEGQKVRVHFETLQLGTGPNTRQREDYTFDGHWAVEAKHSVKQLTRWQVAAEGQTVEALRIGKGSFPPLPFGQKASEVLEYYQATTRPQAAGAPSGSDYLSLAARHERRQELHFVSLQMWVDRATGLPVKIIGTDHDKNTKTVELRNIKSDQGLPADVFELKPGFGWTINTQPLPPRGQGEQP